MGIAIGIDLGTTNSVAAYMKDGVPTVIPNRIRENLTPSAVFLPADGGILVGRPARERLEEFPGETFVSFKRRMGTDWKSKPVRGKPYTPEELSAMVLASLKADAATHLQTAIDKAVITVPANFNSLERQATKNAGEIAGLEVLRVLNEPTAAALAYGQMNRLSRVVVVFDLGGGTFDISVVLSEDNVYEVLFSLGDNRLGGDDFNIRILSFLLDHLKREHEADLSSDRDALRLLRRHAIRAKHALTTEESTRIHIPEIGIGKGQRIDLDITLDRVGLQTIVKPLLDRIQNYARRVVRELAQPRFTGRYGDLFGERLENCDIILVGGETRVLPVQEALQQEFAGRMFNEINPDEVVAFGAAVQAGILQQDASVGDIVLVDSTSLSLGTEVKGGGFSIIIPANTPIPCRKTRNYFTVSDNQTHVLIDVYQGESSIARQNRCLGEFTLSNLPKKPAGEVEVAVTFDLDANDILHVEARDKQSDQRAQTTIKGTQTVSADEVSRMRREALERAAHNDELLRVNNLRHEAMSIIGRAERQLRELKAYLHPDYILRIEAALKALQAALSGGVLSEIERAFYDLVYLHPNDSEQFPSLSLKIVAASGFRVAEWSSLAVTLENSGTGCAHDIQVVVAGESKHRRAAAIEEVAPGARCALALSVYPETYGEAVPLTLSIEYKDENRVPYLMTMDIAIAVAKQGQAPVDVGGTVIRIDKLFQNAGKVNIGENIVSTSVNEPHNGPIPAAVPLQIPKFAVDHSTAGAQGAIGNAASGSDEPGPNALSRDCPICGARNDGSFKFCSNCGHSLASTPKCSQCAAEIKQGMRFCGECGSSVAVD